MKKIVFTALVFMTSCVQKPEQNIVKYEIEDFLTISVYMEVIFLPLRSVLFTAVMKVGFTMFTR